jgi:hypothetical protein
MSSSFPQTQTPPWTDRLRVSITPNRSTDVGTAPLHRVQHLAEALLSARGEASGAIVARELHDDLWSLGAEDRRAFYRFLAANFRPAADPLRIAAEAYLADDSAEAAARLAKTADPPRQELLRRMNMSPGGTEPAWRRLACSPLWRRQTGGRTRPGQKQCAAHFCAYARLIWLAQAAPRSGHRRVLT